MPDKATAAPKTGREMAEQAYPDEPEGGTTLYRCICREAYERGWNEAMAQRLEVTDEMVKVGLEKLSETIGMWPSEFSGDHEFFPAMRDVLEAAMRLRAYLEIR